MRTWSLAAVALVSASTQLVACADFGPPDFATHGGQAAQPNADVHFEPYTAVTHGQAATSAVRIYKGDKPSIDAAGAAFLGELELEAHESLGNPFRHKSSRPNVDALSSRAASEAARRGATHILLVEAGVDVQEYKIAPAQTTTDTVQGYDQSGRRVSQSVTTHHEAQAVRTESPRARFAIFRVEPGAWTNLPGPLRPEPTPAMAAALAAPPPPSTPPPAPVVEAPAPAPAAAPDTGAPATTRVAPAKAREKTKKLAPGY